MSAFATCAPVCLSPASNGSNVPEWPIYSASSPGRRASTRRTSSVRRVAGGGLVEFAIERRAADFQPARDFGHLPAIMRDREADDLVLHFLERTHLSGSRQHRESAGGRQWRDRYLITRYHRRRGRMKRG